MQGQHRKASDNQKACKQINSLCHKYYVPTYTVIVTKFFSLEFFYLRATGKEIPVLHADLSQNIMYLT